MTNLRQRSRRPISAALATLIAALGFACIGPGAEAGSRSCPGIVRDGAVTRILTPSDRPAKAYAVDPDNLDRIFVSDGNGIDRTLDGGCTWTHVYTTDQVVPDNAAGIGAGLEGVAQVLVPGGNAPDGRGLVYATLSPCVAWKVLPHVPGCQVLVSRDDGKTWQSPSLVSGFPPDVEGIESMVVAPAQPNRVYMLAKTATGEALFTSSDGTQSWSQISTAALAPLGVDPLQALDIWAGNTRGLLHSVDGGQNWVTVPVSAGMSVIDVAHERGSATVVTLGYAGGGVLQSRQGGGSFTPMGAAPGPVTSIAHGSTAGNLVVTTDPSGPSAGAPFVFTTGGGWVRIPGLFREQLASGTAASSETFFFADPNAPASIVEYQPGLGRLRSSGPDNIQGASALGPNDGTPRSCYQGPGDELAPGPPSLTVDPAPLGEGPILVDNFASGCLVSFDRYGHSTVLMQAPAWSEGVALTFDRQLVITTRFSSELTITKLPHQKYDVIDADIQNVEGPSFDLHGNLYVEDNADNVVYKYPFPQYPGQPREVVWSFGRGHFIEDTRIAPPNSPFAGDLFVEYYAGSSTSNDSDPDAIAVLAPTRNGWRRLPDFAHLPPKTASVGIAFMPDGSVLVPDWRGSGTVWRYAPNGKSFAPFATVGTAQGVYGFAKIDVTAHGYVYVSSIVNGGAACGPDAELNKGLPVKCDYAAGTRNAIVRFDPTGKRLLPDFTENLSGPVGIAVPNVITGLHQILPPVRRLPPGLLPPGQQPPAPPQQPATGPAPVPAPLAAPAAVAAPGAAPVGQAQAQANPVSQAQPVPQLGAVSQQEKQLQVAVAQVNRAEPATAENSMTALRPTAAHDMRPVFATLLAGSVVLLGCSTLLHNRARPQRALATNRPPPMRSRRRRRRMRD